MVQRANGDEIIVPFVNDFVEEIDTAAKIVRMRLPAGLLELNAERLPVNEAAGSG